MSKDLNADYGKEGASENRFTFASFNDRIKRVKIRLTSARGQDDEVACFFVQGLEKWALLNCTTDYTTFRAQLPFSTLEQVLFHKAKIVDELEKALVPESQCLEPLLDLITLLAKDLQGEFDSSRLLAQISGLICLEQDAKTIEFLYNSVAHIFKYQARDLDLNRVFFLFKNQLLDKKEHIRSFAAECLGFLMRMHAGAHDFFKVIFDDLEDTAERTVNAQNHYSHGLTHLFFELIKVCSFCASSLYTRPFAASKQYTPLSLFKSQ